MKHWKVRTKRIAAAAVCLACVLAGILLAQLPLPGTAGERLSEPKRGTESLLDLGAPHLASCLYDFLT